ncbi:hypothetical protein [Microcella sp.]
MFATPQGRTFFAATDLPPEPMQGIPRSVRCRVPVTTLHELGPLD